MKRVLILIDYSSEFSRGLLRGLIKYTKEVEPWILFRLPLYYLKLHGKEGVVNWAKDWKADAIVAQWDVAGDTLLENLNIPVVLQNYNERSNYFSNLTGNYFETGVLAAKFFANKRFRNFAFYGIKDVVWSNERREGYRTEVEKLGGDFFCYETGTLNDDKWITEYADLEIWLQSLPRPIALFACDDNFALHIAEVCRMRNIDIPNDIALLGVDNDELICMLSDPPISSVVLDVEKGGYDTAKLLHKLIDNKLEKPFNIIINPIRIEARRSTERYVISNKYIKVIVQFITKNYSAKISIKELLELVPLSRRILEVKFKEEVGMSIYQFILSCRIDQLAYLLDTTNRNINDIAFQSGFQDVKNLSRIFKKFKGCTINEYKQRYADLNP
jgi:LacI family transcriptional regulator